MRKLDIFTIKDLIFYYPRYHHDYADIVQLKDLNFERIQTVKVSVTKFNSIKLRGKRAKSIQKAKVHDESGSLEVVWFNQPFIETYFTQNQEVYLAAKLTKNGSKLQITNPEYEILREDQTSTTHLGRISPVYALTEGIRQKWLRQKLKWLLEKLDYISDLKDTLHPHIQKEFSLIDIKAAIQNIHFPDSKTHLEQAERRLGFEELLRIQIDLEKQKRARSETTAPLFTNSDEAYKIVNDFIKSLPFTPTKDQSKAIEDILGDFTLQSPMRRLLQGDVGSGKTLVAVLAGLYVATQKKDVMVMAPTTVLAQQLYNSFKTYLEQFDFTVRLATSSTKNSTKTTPKGSLEMGITEGKSCVTIGTHSLLFLDDTFYSNLGLLIIDEQHRFGVSQREQLTKVLEEREKEPHYLTMTATPIPRTLAMTIFGDIDVSTITEKPKGRKEIKSHLVPHTKRVDSYKWIKNTISDGMQAFWVCPLIEESDNNSIKSAKATHKELQKIFPDLRIELLHGQLKEEQKQKILQDFKDKKFNILVSTSVIEVGIDVPNANIIIIEGAERFGLAQLHQLRGRVGRGESQAYCFLFLSDEINASEKSIERLKYFAKEPDGLKIAEYDLQSRGPGEVYGTKQSGIPNLKIASLTDTALVSETRKAAKLLLDITKH